MLSPAWQSCAHYAVIVSGNKSPSIKVSSVIHRWRRVPASCQLYLEALKESYCRIEVEIRWYRRILVSILLNSMRLSMQLVCI